VYRHAGNRAALKHHKQKAPSQQPLTRGTTTTHEEKTMSTQSNQIVASDLAALQEQADITTSALALKAGLNKGTVSRCINGTYKENSDAYRKVKAALLDCIGQPGASAASSFTTAGQRLMRALLDATLEDKEFTMLTGLSGLGKTHVIKEFMVDHPEAKLLHARLGMSRQGMYKSIATLIGVSKSGTSNDIEERIIAASKGHVLIVDETDLLVDGRKGVQVLRMLDIYRQMFEAGAVVILVGLPELRDSIVLSGKTYLTSRIGYYRNAPAPSLDELGEFWERLMVAYPQAAAKAGPLATQAQRAGLFRHLKYLAKRTRIMDGDVRAAASFLFRPEA